MKTEKCRGSFESLTAKGYCESRTFGLRSDGPKQIGRGNLADVTVRGGSAMASHEELAGDLEEGPTTME